MGLVSAMFKFVAKNPPMALITGGILLITLSIFTSPLDPATTIFLRESAGNLIFLGAFLQILWLFFKIYRQTT